MNPLIPRLLRSATRIAFTILAIVLAFVFLSRVLTDSRHQVMARMERAELRDPFPAASTNGSGPPDTNRPSHVFYGSQQTNR